MQRYLLTLPLILSLMMFGATAALAQEEGVEKVQETQEVEAEVEALASDAQQAEPTYEGIEVQEPQKAPTRFGLVFRGIRERISHAITLSQTKKAEKAMKFAEERMLMAEKMLENATSEDGKEQANKMLGKANEWMEKMQKSQEKAIEKGEKHISRLLQNRAKQFERQEQIMDRIEQKVEEKSDGSNGDVGKVLEFRQMFTEKSRRLENALQNENIPEEVRTHLKEVKERIEAHADEVKKKVEEVKQLQEGVENGDEKARVKFDQFRERRMEELRTKMEKRDEIKQIFKEKLENKFEELEEAVENGDEKASEILKKMKEIPVFREGEQPGFLRRIIRREGNDEEAKEKFETPEAIKDQKGERREFIREKKELEKEMDRREKREERIDRKEDRVDAKEDRGFFDKVEDFFDRRESKPPQGSFEGFKEGTKGEGFGEPQGGFGGPQGGVAPQGGGPEGGEGGAGDPPPQPQQ